MNPVGLVEVRDGYRARPRRFPLPLRLLAGALLLAFGAVGTATTVRTLGAWCLTSDAGSPVAPPPSLR